MTTPTDTDLLHAVAGVRSEPAFRQLVARHIDLVYASALRQVRDPATAEDLTQAAFILLWRKAARLGDGRNLCGWLLSAVRFGARDAARARRSREHHERQAAQMTPAPTAVDWDHLRDRLDAGLADLSSSDRTAIAMRYLGGRSVAQVAADTGLTEEAAKKRTQRALRRLRDALARRGIRSSADLLETGLASLAVAAPPALVDTVARSADKPSPAVEQHVRRMASSVRRAGLRTAGRLAGVALAGGVGVAVLAFALSAPPRPVAIAAPTSRPTTAPTRMPLAEQQQWLDRLEAGLLRQEQLFHNLRVDATARWEKWDAKANVWRRDAESDSTAWYDGIANGKARIDFHKRILPWTDGAGPFSWEVSQQAFDGDADRLLQIEVGTPDHRSKIMQRVEVRYKRSDYAYGVFDSGWRASTFGGVEGAPYSLYVTDVRGLAANGRLALSVTRVPYAGAPCLCLTAAVRSEKSSYYFDPGHGFAFRGSSFAIAPMHDEFIVDELVEAAPGLYYPGRASWVRYHPDEGDTRATFAATSIVANADALDPSTFRLLPRGVPVFEMRADGSAKRIDK
jgi:RNA polymerase sigma factor (sigma-70 family)